MLKLFGILCGLFAASSSSLFINPDSGTQWHWNDEATITWTNTNAINVGVEMIVDGLWSENAPNVSHPFMAHTVDPGRQSFTWSIPFSLTERWRDPIRTVLRLQDGSSVKSDNFTVIGGSFTYPAVVYLGYPLTVGVETNAVGWYMSIFRVSYCSDCPSINRTLTDNNKTNVTWTPETLGTYRYSLNHLSTPTDTGWVRPWLNTIIAVSQPFSVIPITTSTITTSTITTSTITTPTITTSTITTPTITTPTITTPTIHMNVDSCICYDEEQSCRYSSLVQNYTACGNNDTRGRDVYKGCHCGSDCTENVCCPDYEIVCLGTDNPDTCIDHYCTSNETNNMRVCNLDNPYNEYSSLCHALCHNQNLTDLGQCPLTTPISSATTTPASNGSDSNSKSKTKWWVLVIVIAIPLVCISTAGVLIYCSSHKTVQKVSPEAVNHRTITAFENTAYEADSEAEAMTPYENRSVANSHYINTSDSE